MFLLKLCPLLQEEVEEAAELKQAKSSFTVRILKFEPEKKVALIKEIKSIIPGMNLVQVSNSSFESIVHLFLYIFSTHHNMIS